MKDEECNSIGGVPSGMGACHIPNDFIDFALEKDACKNKLKGLIIKLDGIKICSITSLPSKTDFKVLQEAKKIIHPNDVSGMYAFGSFYRFISALKDYKLHRRMDKKFGTDFCADEGIPGDMFEETIEDELNKSHMFEISNGVRLLLSKTEPPNKNDAFKLPFHTVFLDVGFKRDEMAKFGVDIGYKEILGIIVTEASMVVLPKTGFLTSQDIGGKEISKAFRITILGLTDDGSTSFDVFHRNYNLTGEDKAKGVKIRSATPKMCNKQAQKFVHEFVINFLNFIQSPEVSYVEKTVSSEKNLKRMREGKQSIPPRNFITLTGVVKRYAQDINDNPQKWQYSHRFYVMGHWRTLISPKYTRNPDGTPKRTWVESYIKGDGILIPKRYDLEEDGTEHI